MNLFWQTLPKVGRASLPYLLLGGSSALLIVGCTEAQLPTVSTTPLIETTTVEPDQTLESPPDVEALSVETATPTPEIQAETDTPIAAPETPPIETSASTAEVMVSPTASVSSPEAILGVAGYAVRFFGSGSGDIDRVKISLDDPATNAPGPPADIGATDFTLEWWLRADLAENQAPPVECGSGNVNWINGNIIFDRDRYNQDQKFGLSLAGGRLVFGVSGDGTGDYTICGTSKVADGQWHHIAVQRRRADGYLWIFVDGRLEAEGLGPGGDVSYPDDGQPGDFCGGPCVNSDPFLVIGAEKHDAGQEYPSFSGWIDEVRLSSVLRYSADFNRPTAPFQVDVNTVALWHFDEGTGEIVNDAAPGGLSPGTLQVGGPHQGPQWVISDAPLEQ